MINIFEILDKRNKKVRLTTERWTHIRQEHPVVVDIEEIKDTLLFPFIIRPSKHDPEQVMWFYRFNKQKRYYLLVAVKYLNGDGFIITAYYVKNIK